MYLNFFDYLENICLEKVYVITYHDQFKENKGETWIRDKR